MRSRKACNSRRSSILKIHVGDLVEAHSRRGGGVGEVEGGEGSTRGAGPVGERGRNAVGDEHLGRETGSV